MDANLRHQLHSMSTDDLRELNKYAVTILKSRAADMIYTFSAGDKVSFIGRGIRQTGIVTGVNRKTVNVLCGSTPWRVSPNLLKKAS